MTRFLLRATCLAAALAACGAHAQDFPRKDRVLTIVVPFTAGGPTDRVARDLAEALRKPLGGMSIVIDNTAGAGGSIGTAKVARAAADGYTLLLNHIAMATMPGLYRKLPFDVEKDFAYLGIINDVPMTLVGKPTLAANSYRELTDWVAKNKARVNIGNAGVGSASHLCGLLLQSTWKTPLTDVPYKGAAQAIADLMGNQIDLLCDQTTNTTQQIEGKKVKAYAVTTPKRLTTPGLQDLPTMQEVGARDFQVTIWHGLYAPKGTPAPVLKTLNDALRVAVKDPDFVKHEEALGAVVVADKRIDPAEHRKFVAAELAKWTPVIKAAGASAD
ncbi:MAG: tripartite tricarboxylate transporter substrate-binding protein [Pseudomonadota bacterium]